MMRDHHPHEVTIDVAARRDLHGGVHTPAHLGHFRVERWLGKTGRACAQWHAAQMRFRCLGGRARHGRSNRGYDNTAYANIAGPTQDFPSAAKLSVLAHRFLPTGSLAVSSEVASAFLEMSIFTSHCLEAQCI